MKLMPICSKCNTQQPDDLNYCAECGNPLKVIPSKKGIPTKGLILGGCGCAGLVAVLAGVIIVLVFVIMIMQGGSEIPPQQLANWQVISQTANRGH